MIKSHMLKATESGSRANKNSLSSLGGYHGGTWKFMLRAGRGCCWVLLLSQNLGWNLISWKTRVYLAVTPPACLCILVLDT